MIYSKSKAKIIQRTLRNNMCNSVQISFQLSLCDLYFLIFYKSLYILSVEKKDKKKEEGQKNFNLGFVIIFAASVIFRDKFL
jgi:hypothetical protein